MTRVFSSSFATRNIRNVCKIYFFRNSKKHLIKLNNSNNFTTLVCSPRIFRYKIQSPMTLKATHVESEINGSRINIITADSRLKSNGLVVLSPDILKTSQTETVTQKSQSLICIECVGLRRHQRGDVNAEKLLIFIVLYSPKRSSS